METTTNFASKYEHLHTVTADEIDELNHVNNVVYLKWVNDVSALHWNTLAPAALKEKYVWVANRHEIDYHKAAFLGEKINIKTWVEILEGVKSIRIVHIYRDETLLAKSRTTWVLLDAKSHRPARVNAEMQAVFRKAD